MKRYHTIQNSMIKKYLTKNTRFIKYTIFASTIAILEVITFTIFYSLLKIDLLISNTLSFIISVFLLYFVNSKYVFKTNFKSTKAKIKRFYLFLGTRVIGLFLDSLVLYILVEYIGMCSFPSKIISGISTTLINYMVGKYVFK